MLILVSFLLFAALAPAARRQSAAMSLPPTATLV